MSFLFASSHLPETRVQRPDELEDEEDDVQPMLHSGGVRAFSHLPAQRLAADSAGQLAQRGAQALGHQFQRTETQDAATPPGDGIAAAKASGVFDAVRQQFNRDDSPHFMDEDGNLRPRDEARQQASPSPRDPRSPLGVAGAPHRPAWNTGNAAGADSSRSPRTSSSASDDTRPWYMPPITPEDLDSQHSDDDDAAGSHSAFNGRPGVQDLLYRTHGESPPKLELQDLLYRYKGTPEEVRDQRRSYFKNVAAAVDTQDATGQPNADRAGAEPQGTPSAQSIPPERPASGMPPKPQTSPQDQFAGPVITPAAAQQNSGTKPDSTKADETPEGAEYALKFIGGSLFDTFLNTAVTLFGGPGKYSYNPNPLRRAWHVDGWLPKIDREAYNRLQNGVEMLAFSFTEATNPRNRIHLVIPAPAWRNGDGPPLSKEEASRWLKEYHDNVKKTGSGDFRIGVNKNVLKSRLINGTLNFEILRQTDDGTMHGSEMFKAMMDFYGPAVKAIEGNWVFGTNLNKVNELTKGGTPLESAVKQTWTGQQAAAHGFTEVEIKHYAGENGHFSDIQVIFKKPKP